MIRNLKEYLNPRTVHFWAMVLWGTLGAALSYFLRHSVPWVNMMSWYAIVITHATGWGAGRAEQEAKGSSETEA